MKQLFKSRRFKVIAGVIALLLVGALICAANGRGETAQSGIVGTILRPQTGWHPKYQTVLLTFSEKQPAMLNTLSA